MATPRLIDVAEEELAEAHDWYLQRDVVAAAGFRAAIDAALLRISESPESFPFCSGEHRRLILRRYPFSIIYRLVNDEPVVIAVAHAKRRPFYWRTRKP